jgi:ABC-type multidrug transport system fused ATPase/permease subunit
MTSTERVLQYVDLPQEMSVLQEENVSAPALPLLSPSPDIEGAAAGGGKYSLVSQQEQEQPHSVSEEEVTLVVSVDDAAAARAAEVRAGKCLDKSWPATGVVEFSNVWMQYRENPPVLKGVSFRSRAAERIGVCGRTGAGKSSLMSALFRIVKLSKGTITVDGVDIMHVPLQMLRSRLASKSMCSQGLVRVREYVHNALRLCH